jgi:hypothetical protein
VKIEAISFFSAFLGDDESFEMMLFSTQANLQSRVTTKSSNRWQFIHKMIKYYQDLRIMSSYGLTGGST